MLTSTPKKILIAPLDWGLGHTSRCIALALHYHRQGHLIYFAGNAIQQKLFSAACPFVTLIALEGYGVAYPNSGWAFMPKMVAQLPKIQQAIRREHSWLETQMRIHHFDVILSDNRYGLHHPKASSILLTHQLHIQTGTKLGDWVIEAKTKQLLQHFNEVWVVDQEGDGHLAGNLSRSLNLNIPIRYLGWLSQFQFHQGVTAHPLQQRKFVLALLSGPEPMRTQLEGKLLEQMSAQTSLDFVMIAGTLQSPQSLPNNVLYIPLADASTIYPYLQHCEYVISRSGYSTVMDVIYMQKPAFFIPTPGQTEQEYIAHKLSAEGAYLCCTQKDFQLPKVAPQRVYAYPFTTLFPTL